MSCATFFWESILKSVITESYHWSDPCYIFPNTLQPPPDFTASPPSKSQFKPWIWWTSKWLLSAKLHIVESRLSPWPWAISRKWGSDRKYILIEVLPDGGRVVNFTCSAKGHGAWSSALGADMSKRKLKDHLARERRSWGGGGTKPQTPILAMNKDKQTARKS